MIWNISQDGLSASRVLDTGGVESKLLSAIDPEELVLAVPPTSIDLSIEVRSKRDTLLSTCDWTQCQDTPTALVVVWQPYRQALRDITKQPNFPNSIIWPEKP